MKIRMLISIGGSDFTLSRGEETDRFSAKEAKRLIADGAAEPVVDAAVKTEKAVKRPASEKRG